MGGQNWVAWFDEPIQKPFRRAQFWVQADSDQILSAKISDIFHAMDIIRSGWTFAVQVERLFGKEWGGQRDSNPQQQAPQAWTLPLSYGHQPAQTLSCPGLPVKSLATSFEATDEHRSTQIKAWWTQTTSSERSLSYSALSVLICVHPWSSRENSHK